MLTLRRIAGLGLLALALGCSMASESDLIGTWIVEGDSRGRLPEMFQKASVTVTLEADGTFSMREWPHTFYDRDSRRWRTELANGSGEWTLVRRLELQFVKLTFREITPGGAPYGWELDVHGGLRRTILAYAFDDPDSTPVFFTKTR